MSKNNKGITKQQEHLMRQAVSCRQVRTCFGCPSVKKCQKKVLKEFPFWKGLGGGNLQNQMC